MRQRRKGATPIVFKGRGTDHREHGSAFVEVAVCVTCGSHTRTLAEEAAPVPSTVGECCDDLRQILCCDDADAFMAIADPDKRIAWVKRRYGTAEVVVPEPEPEPPTPLRRTGMVRVRWQRVERVETRQMEFSF